MAHDTKKVLVFGVFDRLHDGHRFFLREARAYGDILLVAVAPDEIVRILKKRSPYESVDMRIAHIKQEHLAQVVFAGDGRLNDWDAVQLYKPDCIALGYDQVSLREPLETFLKNAHLKIDVVLLPPYQDGGLHTSSLK